MAHAGWRGRSRRRTRRSTATRSSAWRRAPARRQPFAWASRPPRRSPPPSATRSAAPRSVRGVPTAADRASPVMPGSIARHARHHRAARELRHRPGRQLRAARGLPADDPRERLHPGAERGDHALRRASWSSQGDENLWLMVAAGVPGNVVGSWIAYGSAATRAASGRCAGTGCTSRPSASTAPTAGSQRYGDWAVLLSRCLPIIRTFISLPAGIARMPFWRFTILTADRLHPVGPDAHARRPRGGRQLGGPAEAAALLRLRPHPHRSSAASSGWWCATAPQAPLGMAISRPSRTRAAD